MTTVVPCDGTHRDDPDSRLLLGDDGVFDAAPDHEAPPTPSEPSEEWVLLPMTKAEDEPASH
jgi:hypothetical protein